MLSQFSSYSHLLAGKEDLKSGIGGGPKQVQMAGANTENVDRGAIKQAL